jgi:hypothetical protein
MDAVPSGTVIFLLTGMVCDTKPAVSIVGGSTTSTVLIAVEVIVGLPSGGS